VSYKTYITEALVCGSKASNTSDRSYLLFTREAGMLYAQAKSVREERSKQRFALQEFSYVRSTLIHGKSGWRIAGVEPILNLYAEAHTREARALVRNSIVLLRRFLTGADPHESLFDDVLRTLVASREAYVSYTELVLTVRVLYALGYIAPQAVHKDVLDAEDVIAVARTITPEIARACEKAIDHAHKESQL